MEAGLEAVEVGPHHLEGEVRRHQLDQTEVLLLHHIILARTGQILMVSVRLVSASR
jgi:hypothetical protein